MLLVLYIRTAVDKRHVFGQSNINGEEIKPVDLSIVEYWLEVIS